MYKFTVNKPKEKNTQDIQYTKQVGNGIEK